MLATVILFLDFQHVDNNEISHPHFYYKKISRGQCVGYKSLLWNCMIYKNSDSKNNQGGYVCNVNLEDSIEDYIDERWCDKDYDWRKDCEVVKCDENGKPLFESE